jgi:hypothetical protein
MSQTAPKPEEQAKVEGKPAAEEEPTPPPEEFWDKYSPRYELPISTVASIAVHVLMVGLLVLYLLGSFDRSKRPPMEIGMAEGNPDGDDREEGAAGGGGSERQDKIEKRDPTNTPLPKLDQIQFNQVKEQAKNLLPQMSDDADLDDLLNTPVAADKFKDLQDAAAAAMARNLNRPGPKEGEGTGTGKKGTGPGAGPQGDPNSRAKQLIRWTIRFETYGADVKARGDDYLRQLAGLGAWIALPLGNDPNRVTLYKDLAARPLRGEVMKIDDLEGRIFFTDNRPESLEQVALAMGLGEPPAGMRAMFPFEIEDQMRTLEKQRLGRRNLNDVQQTYFRPFFQGGKWALRVEDQTYRRGR